MKKGQNLMLTTPYARILPLIGRTDFTPDDGIACLKHIEWCARISHRSEDAVTEMSYDRFLRSVVLHHGDWSVAEHVTLSVDILTDRGITHELVRHRLFSFTQESTRFVNYEKKMPALFISPPTLSEKQRQRWSFTIDVIESIYKEFISQGVAPQIARSVFPNALASRIIITGNLRNWRHFFLMRTTKEAHPQMKEVTIPLLLEFQEKIPILYDDILPETKQSDNLMKGR